MPGGVARAAAVLLPAAAAAPSAAAGHGGGFELLLLLVLFRKIEPFSGPSSYGCTRKTDPKVGIQEFQDGGLAEW